MSNNKKSRQQLRQEQRQTNKKGIKPILTKKPFWKKPVFIAIATLVVIVGVFALNTSKNRKTGHHTVTQKPDNSLLTPASLQPLTSMPNKGAKVRRKGKWVMAKNIQPGDSVWYKGKWQVVQRTQTIDTLLPEDPKRPIIDYFIDPNHLQQVFAFRSIPLSKYTAKEIEIQKSFNKDYLLLTYATLPDSVYSQYDNLQLPAHRRNIDFDEITPWTWKTFKLEITEPDGSKVKIQLRRPHWWMSQHKIKGIGSKVRSSSQFGYSS